MTRREAPWGVWDPLGPREVAAVMRGFRRPWWIAGGYAIDALCGQGRREHGDIDIGLFAADQVAVRTHLRGWDPHAADPPGTLRPWAEEEALPAEVHDIWVRRDEADAWRFQLMLNPRDGDDWVYRRDSRIRRPIGDLVWWREGIPYLAPEIQLLFKSKGAREKDRQDFEDALPLLEREQRQWLAAALGVASPGHEWLERLDS